MIPLFDVINIQILIYFTAVARYFKTGIYIISYNIHIMDLVWLENMPCNKISTY